MPTYLDWPLEETPSLEEEYDRYAGVYDLLFGARDSDLEFYVKQAQTLVPAGGELLELGTGTGRVAERLVEAGLRVTGVDFSRQMLAHAQARAGRLGGQFSPVWGDVRRLALGRKFPLVIAPFGMMAHLLGEEDRLAAMRVVYEHLEPGGVFLFDDMPTWLGGGSEGDKLEVVKTVQEPGTGLRVRLMVTSIDVAGQPLTLCYHLIDWLDGERLARRLVVRVLFRNTALEDELGWLERAGLGRVELLGGFDGRPFDRGTPGANTRLILVCRKPL